MLQFVERIHKFNSDAGLLEKGYDDFLESSFQIEEALEGFDNTHLSKLLKPSLPVMSPKSISRTIVRYANWEEDANTITDVDRLDKAIDSIVYAIGSIAKLGLNPEQTERAIDIVMQANETKLTCNKDEHGKLGKPSNFEGPEAALQSILDEREG